MSPLIGLLDALQAAGLLIESAGGPKAQPEEDIPPSTWHEGPAGFVRLDWNAPPSEQQKASAAAIVANHDGRTRVAAEAAVEASLRSKARNAIATLESADANWASLTNVQKDAALRLCVRATAKLARLAVRQLDSD